MYDPYMGILREHLEDCRRQNMSPGTISQRRYTLQRCYHHVGHGLLEATPEELLDWMDSRIVTAKTRYTYISHLSSFYRWAIWAGFGEWDPTTKIRRPKLKPNLPRPIATDDLRFAVDNAEPSMRAMLCLAAYAGCRCCEVANLAVEDVLDTRQPPVLLLNGKGGKQRVVPLHPTCAIALRPVMPRRGSVFGLDATKVSQRIGAHLRDCGIAATAHQLRHWFATNVYEASGGDLRLTQELLGHASPSTTAVYTAWSKSRAAGVVERLEITS